MAIQLLLPLVGSFLQVMLNNNKMMLRLTPQRKDRDDRVGHPPDNSAVHALDSLRCPCAVHVLGTIDWSKDDDGKTPDRKPEHDADRRTLRRRPD
jgi:hypothetical protein